MDGVISPKTLFAQYFKHEDSKTATMELYVSPKITITTLTDSIEMSKSIDMNAYSNND